MYLGKVDNFEYIKGILEGTSHVTFTTPFKSQRFVFDGMNVYVKMNLGFSGWCLLEIGRVVQFHEKNRQKEYAVVHFQSEFLKGEGSMLFKTTVQKVVFGCTEGSRVTNCFFWVDGDGRLFLEVIPEKASVG